MTWDDYERTLLAIDVWREARNQIRAAKIAVAFSVLERVKKPCWWGDSISAVVAKCWQYSSMSAPGDPNLVKWPIRDDPSFVDTMAAVDSVLDGTATNPAPNGDSYFDNSLKTPPAWATPDKFIATVGAFNFYNVNQDHENVPGVSQ